MVTLQELGICLSLMFISQKFRGGEVARSWHICVIDEKIDARSVPFTFTVYSLSVCHHLALVSAADQHINGRAMHYIVYLIMHVKDPILSVVGAGHHVPVVVFCLSLYSLYVLNRDVDMIKTNKQTNKLNVKNTVLVIHVACAIKCLCFVSETF